jgi:hypothetical protein
MTEKTNGRIKIYSLVIGILYLGLGLLQTLFGFGLDLGISEFLLLAEDGIGGLALMIIGLVFLFGFTRASRSSKEGVAFGFVGTALGMFFFVIYVLILLADVFEAKVLVSEDWEGWVLLDSIRPGLYLGFMTFLGFFIFGKDFQFNSSSPVFT